MWVKVERGLVRASEIEALTISQDIDSGDYQVLVWTKGGGKYTYASYKTREEAQKLAEEVSACLSQF